MVKLGDDLIAGFFSIELQRLQLGSFIFGEAAPARSFSPSLKNRPESRMLWRKKIPEPREGLPRHATAPIPERIG
jgi:hypothetical protein